MKALGGKLWNYVSRHSGGSAIIAALFVYAIVLTAVSHLHHEGCFHRGLKVVDPGNVGDVASHGDVLFVELVSVSGDAHNDQQSEPLFHFCHDSSVKIAQGNLPTLVRSQKGRDRSEAGEGQGRQFSQWIRPANFDGSAEVRRDLSGLWRRCNWLPVFSGAMIMGSA